MNVVSNHHAQCAILGTGYGIMANAIAMRWFQKASLTRYALNAKKTGEAAAARDKKRAALKIQQIQDLLKNREMFKCISYA